VAERVVDFLMEDSTLGPMELQRRLQKKYALAIPYDKVFRGKEKTLDLIFGKWDDSYDILPTYRAELLKAVPGSIVELDTENHHGDVYFRRFFVALKPCIDGFFTKMQALHCYRCSPHRKVKGSVGSCCFCRWK
jgi:hypothetical protein